MKSMATVRFRLARRNWAIFTVAGLAVGLSRANEPDRPADAKPVPTQPALLDLFVGYWDVVETHFDERGGVVATVKGHEDAKWILDRRAVQRTYASGSEPAVYRAIGTFSHSEAEKAFVGVWFDNAATNGPTTVKGTWDDASRSFVCISESKGSDGATIRHKVVERFPDSKSRLVTTYRMRGSDIVKTLEVRCTRTTPCPSSFRSIFEE